VYNTLIIPAFFFVIPAEAGIQNLKIYNTLVIPARAGIQLI